MEEVIEIKNKKLLRTIVKSSVKEVIHIANELGVTQEEFVQIVTIGGQVMLIYYREK